MKIAAVATAFPSHYYDQQTLLEGLKTLWGDKIGNLGRLERIHENVQVRGRHLALPIEQYSQLRSFGDSNDAFVRCAVNLGEQAIKRALDQASLRPTDVGHIMFVSSTGLSTPSVDAYLINRLEMRDDVKRSPMFGLGCVAGAAGIARMADYLKAYPEQVGVVLSVELCSLTLQQEDISVANMVSTGLFGDGAAAVVMAGKDHKPSGDVFAKISGPEIVATRSVFYRHTEHVMGWHITGSGLRVVLTAEVPQIVRSQIRSNVDDFLAEHGLVRSNIAHYFCHTGGPKVLRAFEEALDLSEDALAESWRSLYEVGNLSSASVLTVIEASLRTKKPQTGEYGLIVAMGPGFGSQFVLLRW